MAASLESLVLPAWLAGLLPLDGAEHWLGDLLGHGHVLERLLGLGSDALEGGAERSRIRRVNMTLKAYQAALIMAICLSGLASPATLLLGTAGTETEYW